MVIKAKGSDVERAPTPLRQQPVSPLQRLMDFGMAKTPAEAKKLLVELLQLLGGLGFVPKSAGSPEAQFQQALAQFQAAEGVHPDGVLSRDTLSLLQDASSSPSPAAHDPHVAGPPLSTAPLGSAAAELQSRFGGDFGLPQPGTSLSAPTGGDTPGAVVTPQRQEVQARTASVAARTAPPLDLKQLLTTLARAGFAGGGKGAHRLKDAVARLQRSEGLPPTGKLDPPTITSLLRRQVIDAPTAEHWRAVVAADVPPPPPPSKALSSAAPPPASPSAPATSAPSLNNAQSSASSAAPPLPQTTTAPPTASAKADAARLAQGQAATGEARGQVGNAPSGDRVLDAHRGDAIRMDDEDEADGHYEIPTLAQQVTELLDTLVRDDDGRQAATYAWELVLYRPGIYRKRQSAEPVLKLKVHHASAFDPLWNQVIDAINDKLDRYEPDTFVLRHDMLTHALRRARVR